MDFKLELLIFFALFLYPGNCASIPEAEEKLDSSSMNADFENGLGNWFDSSAAGVKWNVEESSSPLEPNPAPQPISGSKYLRVTRNPANSFGTAILRSRSFTAVPGDEFTLTFWIRSLHLWSNNLEIYWWNGSGEELLLELNSFSYPANFEWRTASAAIPVTIPTETNIRIYGFIGDNEEDAIAIDDIIIGQGGNPESTTPSGQTTTTGSSGTGSTTQSSSSTGTGTTGTTSMGPTIPSEVQCVPSGSLVSSEAKCMRYNEMCYCRYKPLGWSWPLANWYCRNASMHLVSLQSSYEESWVSSFVGSGGYWTSGVRATFSSNWTWASTGESFSYTHWSSTEEAEEIGYMYFTAQPIAWYATEGLTSGLNIICEEPKFTYPTSPPPTKGPPQAGCPMDEGFMTWYPGQVLNGKQYCFSSYWSDWDSADNYCGSANLRLVSFETEAESTLVNQHISQNNYDIGGGFWTSGRCEAVSSTWVWSASGQTISYDKFNSTESAVCNSSNYGNNLWFSNVLDGKWFVNAKYYNRQIVCEQP